MSEYIIFADSGCDIAPEVLAEWGVPYQPLIFRFVDSEEIYNDGDIPADEFYEKMKEGAVAKTSAVNSEAFSAAFDPILASGKDLLYIGFSSALSTTYNSARLAAEQLREKYPERKLITVDSLCASAGLGLLIYLAVQKKNEGADIDEVAEFVEATKLHICHWFTVDDLVYLKRGGRINAASAFFGNALGIKPVMHVDDEGHLVLVAKVRGRKTSLTSLLDSYSKLAVEPDGGTVFMCQGDCRDDAAELARRIKEKHGVEVKIIADIGAIIGSHSGPGTIAVFFVGKER